MKNNKLYIQIRNKKIGILLIDARRSRNFSIEEVANKTGISADRLEDFENGTLSPSLPELEILAYTFNIPFEHFWGKQVFQSDEETNGTEKFQILIKLRNKIIGTGIKSKRQTVNISLEELAEKCEIDSDLLTQYESGEVEIPVPNLEIIAKNLNARIEDFFDNQGKIGAWRTQNAELKSLRDLPVEFREFITKPINEPYLDLAMKLSQLDVKKLRLVAEGLLEITL
jgi:transcriptional regulator with XRE-family HTH domain